MVWGMYSGYITRQGRMDITRVARCSLDLGGHFLRHKGLSMSLLDYEWLPT